MDHTTANSIHCMRKDALSAVQWMCYKRKDNSERLSIWEVVLSSQPFNGKSFLSAGITQTNLPHICDQCSHQDLTAKEHIKFNIVGFTNN